MRRKLFDYTICLISGILIGFYVSQLLIMICSVPVAGWLVWNIRQNRQFSMLMTRICFCMLGLTVMLLTEFQYSHGIAQKQYMFADEDIMITGSVIHIECVDDESFRFTLDLSHEKLLCSYYSPLEQPWSLLGCKISFYGHVEEPESNGNPRCFDYNLYLRSQGIGGVSTMDSFDVVETHPSVWHRIQRHILEKRDEFLALFSDVKTSKGLLQGILFGDTNEMDEELYDNFRKNGTAHVLAVSGLHIGMLYGIYRKVYAVIHRRWMTAVFLLMLFIYGTATLWSVSVTRAVFLICLVVLGEETHRRYDLLTALAAAAFLVMVRNPYVIFSAGFQMSFLAVVSIVFLREPMERFWGETLSTALAVQVGLMPYMAYVFNYISLVGVICNVPVVFLASLIVPIGLTGFMLYFLLDVSFPLLNLLLEALGQMMVFVNGWFSAGGWLSFDVVSPPLWVMVLIYGVLFYGTSEQARVLWTRKQWNVWLKSLALIFMVAIMAFFVGGSHFDRASLVFVDVGQGDCLHIKGDNGRTMLIDGGGTINYNVGEKVLKPYLLKNGFNRVDLAAATHLHTDHYLGLEQLDACFDVRSLLTKGKAGDIIKISSRQWIEILWPIEREPKTEDENLNSLIFMIHDHGIKTLITGDITEEGERLLVNQYAGTDKLQADVLKIAHHGSKYSSSEAFLKVVNPSVAVISVGKNNYGHPSEIVIEKLEKDGIIVFRTDLDGAVGIINRKGKISVCTEKQR